MTSTAFTQAFRERLREVTGHGDVAVAMSILSGEPLPASAPAPEQEETALSREAREVGLYDLRTENLLRTIDLLTAQLGRVQSVVDAGLEPLLAELRARVTSRTTADQAINIYDLGWFQRHPYSVSAKARLAGVLSTLVEPHYGAAPLLWQNIVNRDPATTRLIIYSVEPSVG